MALTAAASLTSTANLKVNVKSGAASTGGFLSMAVSLWNAISQAGDYKQTLQSYLRETSQRLCFGRKCFDCIFNRTQPHQ